MALPKVSVPTFKLVLPSNKQTIKFRPFTVKEEKLLLIGMQNTEEQDQIETVKQIIQNCIIEPEDFNVDELAFFDIEYLFAKLRSKSVGEIIKIKLTAQKRKGLPPMDAELNLEELEPISGEGHSEMVKINDQFTIKMKYPTFALIRELNSIGDNVDALFSIFTKSIEKLYDGEEVYDMSTTTEEELRAFLESLQTKDFQKLQDFFNTMPHLEKVYTYTWTNPEDANDTHTEEITLRGIMSFLS